MERKNETSSLILDRMKLRPLFILLAALTLSATVRSAPGTLIPRPQEATRLDGQFVFTTGIPVVYASGLEPLAEYIADYHSLAAAWTTAPGRRGLRCGSRSTGRWTTNPIG